jgi:hypothetical protein
MINCEFIEGTRVLFRVRIFFYRHYYFCRWIDVHDDADEELQDYRRCCKEKSEEDLLIFPMVNILK